MEKVLVFSDLHLGPESKKVWGRDPGAVLRRALEQAMARHGDAEALILLGDLADDGRRESYMHLEKLLSRIPMPVVPMLGNTDRRSRFQEVFPKAPMLPSGHVQTYVDLPRHRLITLDTLDGPPYKADHHAGRLCADRMAWLMQVLDSCGDRHPVVFTHHPPMKIGAPAHDAIRLSDGPELMELLSGYPGLHLICGHVHRPVSGISRGVSYSIMGSLLAPFDFDLTGDEITLLKGPGSYGVVLLQKNGISVNHQAVL